MKIWIINHYAVPTKYYPLARPAMFAKHLMDMGHEVTIFAASTVHNSDLNLITDQSLYKEDYVDGIHYVYVRDIDYNGNGIKRIINMLLFPPRLKKVCRNFAKPDAILSVSLTPMACMEGIKLAHRYGCRGVAEIADLWPESVVAYGVAGRKNPIVQALYALEKRIYTKADAVIFTMEGGRDYIIEKGWDKAHGGPVDLNKVHYINNGVDLDVFEYNRVKYAFPDADLDDPNHFKVVYTGSIRKVNGVGQLVDAAEQLKKRGNTAVRILVYGDGDEREALEQKAMALGLDNIVFKGKVKKEAVPYVLSKADACLLHWMPTPITKFGMSMNKSFEYLASGKPLISNVQPKYDLIAENKCGLSENISSPEEYAELMERLYKMPKDVYETYCRNSRTAAETYDFKKLTSKLLEVLGSAGK